MGFMIEQIINGIMIGSTYAIIALGFTLIFGILNVLNLAQTEMLTWGTFVGYVLNIHFGLSFPFVLMGGVLFVACLGLLIERLAIRPIINPFKESEPLAPLISTIGVGMVLQTVAVKVFSPKGIAFPLSLGKGAIELSGVYVSLSKLTAFFISVGLMCLLMGILYRTTLGKKIRATAQDPKAAIFLGVNIYSIFALVMAMSSALGAVGGLLIASIYGVITPFMGLELGLKGLVVMILGGVTSLTGAMAGGVLLGVLESLIIGYISSAYVDAAAFGILILILIVRPGGLLPSFK